MGLFFYIVHSFTTDSTDHYKIRTKTHSFPSNFLCVNWSTSLCTFYALLFQTKRRWLYISLFIQKKEMIHWDSTIIILQKKLFTHIIYVYYYDHRSNPDIVEYYMRYFNALGIITSYFISLSVELKCWQP